MLHPDPHDRQASGRTSPTRTPRRAAEHPASHSAGLGVLGRLIEAYGAEALTADPPTPGAGNGLLEVARLLCAEAKREDPRRAERLIIALHAAWPMLPAVQRIPPGQGRDALLSRVVALCIAEFYAESANSAVSPAERIEGAGRVVSA